LLAAKGRRGGRQLKRREAPYVRGVRKGGRRSSASDYAMKKKGKGRSGEKGGHPSINSRREKRKRVRNVYYRFAQKKKRASEKKGNFFLLFLEEEGKDTYEKLLEKGKEDLRDAWRGGGGGWVWGSIYRGEEEERLNLKGEKIILL